MESNQFKELLKKANFTKKSFASYVKIPHSTVNAWGSANKPPVPYWVESWLNLYIENKKCKELKQIIKDSVCED